MPQAGDWFARFQIPIQPWIDQNFFWLSAYWRPYIEVIRAPLAQTIDALTYLLAAIPPPVILLLVFLAAWQASGLLSGIVVVLILGLVGCLGVWADTVETCSLVLVSVLLCLLVGLPVGLAAARSDRLERVLKPLLDLMQTLPAFVYLVPIVLLIGIGNVPGVFVTFIFAVPPTIRLTSLGIRGVPAPMVEAAEALGASSAQVLFKVEIPNALESILLGVNQTILMALAMTTYAAMIGVDGLGRLVLRGIGRLDLGLATVGGLGIVALAIIFSQLIVPKRLAPAGLVWLGSPWALMRAIAARSGFASFSRASASPAISTEPVHGDENHA